MVKTLLTGNAAAAWGARLADVDYVPAFPITPQTEIIETLANWFGSGQLKGRFVMMDSEHSMITAAGAAAATGVRTFTATSSQGLVYAMEVLYTVAGWRVPLVLVNVSRALSAPITLGPDHNDVLAARDAGFVQIHAETCQEVLDSTLMAFRIAEDARVSVPVLVNLDGFYLSFTREPVEIPDPERARAFLPAFATEHAVFRASRPVAQGVAVLDGATYSYFRYQSHLAVQNALEVHGEAAALFHRLFGRLYGPIETDQIDDAEIVLVMGGSYSSKARGMIRRWRQAGRRVGLVRIRLVRPWPAEALLAVLAGQLRHRRARPEPVAGARRHPLPRAGGHSGRRAGDSARPALVHRRAGGQGHRTGRVRSHSRSSRIGFPGGQSGRGRITVHRARLGAGAPGTANRRQDGRGQPVRVSASSTRAPRIFPPRSSSAPARRCAPGAAG